MSVATSSCLNGNIYRAPLWPALPAHQAHTDATLPRPVCMTSTYGSAATRCINQHGPEFVDMEQQDSSSCVAFL